MVSTGIRNNYRGPDLKLFVRDVLEGKKRPVEVRSWSTIKDVKDVLQQKLGVPASSIRLYYGPLLTSGGELPNYRTLHDAGIYRSGETLLLDIKNNADSSLFHSSRNSNDICISSSMNDLTPKQLRNSIAQARRGFSLGLKPELVMEGSGGTYFLHDARKSKIAVFKPADEEPYAENNPRGYLRQPGQNMSLREGVKPGEACIREVAAYLLDRDGFSSVPQTTLCEARHSAFNTNGARLNVSQGGASIGSHSIAPNSPVRSPLMKKPGSFQEFVRCECTIDDISPSKIRTEEVHKIAILDIRIMNADRNAANLLVRRKQDNTLELVPIDHGYCLRSVCDVSWMDWCWLDWPQLKEPISDSQKKYIKNLDIEADARMLRERLNICEEAVDYFRASSALLKAGVAAGLTLYDIAILCCRNDNLAEEPSMMEKLFDMASELAQVAVQSDRWHHSAASRALVEQLCPSITARRASVATTGSSNSSGHFSRSILGGGLVTMTSTISDTSANRESPGMAQSSGSETSSENGDDEKESCQEWAATLIEGLSERNIVSLSRPSRSSSVSSDDNCSDCSNLSSGELKKFWVVPPGSSKAKKADEDDDSSQWSPRSSARDSPFELLTGGPEPPFYIGTGKENEEEDTKKHSVTFADDMKSAHTFSPPVLVNIPDTETKPSDLDWRLPEKSIPKPEVNGMPRSKSYTALSASSGRLGKNKTLTSLQQYENKFSEPSEHYRKYFHKFIDLVIVREVTAALHHSKHAGITF